MVHLYGVFYVKLWFRGQCVNKSYDSETHCVFCKAMVQRIVYLCKAMIQRQRLSYVKICFRGQNVYVKL